MMDLGTDGAASAFGYRKCGSPPALNLRPRFLDILDITKPPTHALIVIFAISLLNLRKLESFRRPPTAPPSSIRSHKNWHSTCTCCMVKKLDGIAPMTEERYCTAFARTVASSSLIYSPRDCTISISDTCFDSSPALGELRLSM